MRRKHANALAGLLVFAATASTANDRIPTCRLDDAMKETVVDTLVRSSAAFKMLGKALPFDRVIVNESVAQDGHTLVAYIVKDANTNFVTPQGCAKGPVKSDDSLDALSVRGGCLLTAVDRMEIRCSASAVKVFGEIGQKQGRSNPALLYVLSHELGHLYQKRLGEYTGRTERIDLSRDQLTKLKELQNSCDPNSTRKEEEADAIAIEVLTKLLPNAPYREPLFSDRGSIFWNIDQLALAANDWQKLSLEREFISRPTVHKAFEPTEFPTPQKSIEANAHRFVCDVLTTRSGDIYYPSKSLTHPPVEQRLRRVAESLQPVAKALSDNSAQRQFAPVARLQTDLGPIFTHIYRETGVYREAVQARICSEVNAPQPPKCR